MFNSERLYDVSFNIICYTPDSPMFAFLSILSQLKEARFEFIAINDERWREIELILTNIGLNLVHVEKEPHMEDEPEEDPEPEEIEIDEELSGDKKVGILFDEMITRREKIYKAAQEDKDEAAVQMNARDYNATSAAFMKELKRQIIEELLDSGTE